MMRRGLRDLLTGVSRVSDDASEARALTRPSRSYSRSLYGLAKCHAQASATVTATDLASKLNISVETAEEILDEMVASGLIGQASPPSVIEAVRELPDEAASEPKGDTERLARYLQSRTSTERSSK